MGSAHTLRLAHVTHWTLPSNDTATIQLVQNLSALAELGLEAELYSPRPPWRAARPSEVLQRELAGHYGAPCGFTPYELPSRLPGAKGLSRLLHAWLTVRATKGKPDIVVHTRDLETAWVCTQAGHPVLFETFKLWTRRSRFHRALLLRLARQASFLGLVAHSHFAAEQFLQDGFPPAKLRAIHNGFDPGIFALRRTPPAARAALGLPEAPTVAFLGVLAPHKRVDLLLDAAAQAPEIRWVLGGDPALPEARALVARGRAIPNVSFPGYVTGERLALLLQAGDVLVIPPSVDPLKRFGRTVLPLKVFQYLAAGRAIVAGATADTAELLDHDRNCLRIPPDQPETLVTTVRALLGDPERRARLGEAARRDSAGLTWSARAEAFLSFLHERAGNIW
jgi:glycosyltransferase involved in cell wall biosynthesis